MLVRAWAREGPAATPGMWAGSGQPPPLPASHWAMEEPPAKDKARAAWGHGEGTAHGVLSEMASGLLSDALFICFRLKCFAAACLPDNKLRILL